jgi:hypothetical protein
MISKLRFSERLVRVGDQSDMSRRRGCGNREHLAAFRCYSLRGQTHYSLHCVTFCIGLTIIAYFAHMCRRLALSVVSSHVLVSLLILGSV